MDMLGRSLAFAGIPIVRCRDLEPRLLKDTFSGGINETRRGMNESALDESMHLYRLKDPFTGRETLLGAEHAIARVFWAMGEPYTMKRHHPALVEWSRFWMRAEQIGRETSELARRHTREVLRRG